MQQQDPKSFLPCPHCLGFFKGDELWRHAKKCPHQSQDGSQKFSKVQQDAKLLLPTSSLSTNNVDQAPYRAVQTNMKNDEISHIARKDNLIFKFGEINFEKVGQKNANYVLQRMRQLARLLKTLRGKSQNEDSRLEDYINTSKFDELVLAVKDLCGFDAETRLDIGIPSLALNLGHSLKRCAQVLRSSALRSKDEVLIKQSKRFLDLFEAEWANKISSRSLASLGSKKKKKTSWSTCPWPNISLC